MTFAEPRALLLFLVVALMAAVALWLLHWRRQARQAFAGEQARRWSGASPWPLLLVLAAAVLIVIAAARPQWGDKELVREREGLDVVFALDVSQSMLARDAEPSRLEQAQQQIIRLIEAERGHRFGLVLFAGSAILRSPLTTDTQAVAELVRRAGNEGGLVRGGSDMGAALAEAADILAASESPGKAIIVVSDGEDHVGDFEQRAAALSAQNVLILTAGTGSPEGSTIPVPAPEGQEEGVKLDANNEPIISRLEADNLQALAEAGGGRSIRLGEADLLSFREDLSRLQAAPLGEQTTRIPIERFQAFVAAALALLIEAWFVPLRLRLPSLRLDRLRLGPHAGGLGLLLIVLLVGACADNSLRAHNQRANRLYDSGDYQAALERYQELIAKRPDVPELSYNAGNAQHRLGNYQRAVEETLRSLPSADPGIGALSYYSLGNHQLALGNLPQAYDAYRNALVLRPDDEDAKHNLELVLALMRQQEEQEQQQNEQGQGENGEGQPDDGQPQPGEQQPQPGDGQPPQDPSQGEPQPGEDQPQPGDDQNQPQPGSQPPDGSPTQPDQTPTNPSDVQRSLEEALRGIDEQLTYEEALQLLDLLRREQQNQTIPGPGNQPGEADY